jgi:preprotein translocase subunit SecA
VALVDEADSLLIDEATMPLVLSEAVNDPRHRAWCFQALALARELELGRHVQVSGLDRPVQWTEEGEAQVRDRASALGGAWLNSRHRLDLVGSALMALHALRRDEHYVVDAQGVQLLDAHTGRAAPGRVWSRGLHTLVEMKEGCKTSPPTQTTAQTSYQRFFARYLHLAGTSGTLQECRRELRAVYGLEVVTVPLRHPSRRQLLPPRRFADALGREAALAARIQALRSQGRPVLVGVATVEQAERVSAGLRSAGIPYQRLDARHDSQEAAVLAQAGQPGQVTVATAMAGRGTDIHLAPGVAARGGLHVIVCQDNRRARLDRQFIGRCARQGDPGSAELWLTGGAAPWPAAASRMFRAWQHQMNETRDRRRRRRLWEEDLSWEKRLDFQHLHA